MSSFSFYILLFYLHILLIILNLLFFLVANYTKNASFPTIIHSIFSMILYISASVFYFLPIFHCFTAFFYAL